MNHGPTKTIPAYDNYGQLVLIDREIWRTKMLPESIKKAWEDPAELYTTLAMALDEGFPAEILTATKHLVQIHPEKNQAVCVHVTALLALGQNKEAKETITLFIQQNQGTANTYTILSKILEKEGKSEESFKLAWQAVEADPNDKDAVEWLLALEFTYKNQKAADRTLQKLIAMPKSYRASAWVGVGETYNGNLKKGLALFQNSLEIAPKPIPSDILEWIGTCLLNCQHNEALLQTLTPHFQPKTHGLSVSKNIWAAFIELGRIEKAIELVDTLYAENRPDWKSQLRDWEAKMQDQLNAKRKTQPKKIRAIGYQAPGWLRQHSPAAELYEAKDADATSITFIGGTMDMTKAEAENRKELTDSSCRMTRAIPTILSELTEMGTDAQGIITTLWCEQGFVISQNPLDTEVAIGIDQKRKTDYIVTIHLSNKPSTWIATAKINQNITGKTIGEANSSINKGQPYAGILRLWESIKTQLIQTGDVDTKVVPKEYNIPKGRGFYPYMLTADQAVSIRIQKELAKVKTRLGHRERLDTMVHVCRQHPQTIPTRIILLETLRELSQDKPSLKKEYIHKVKRLQEENPLEEPSQSVINRMIQDLCH